MDAELIRSLGTNRPLLAFIPTEFEDADEYYDEFIDRFGRHAFCRFRCLDLEKKFTPRKAQEIFDADMIYLSGGNTFHLLHHLRERNMLPALREYVASGGVLCGHSAGAIIMTPSITTASFPDWDRDDNDVGIVDYAAMGLVGFELFPHFTPTPAYLRELKLHTQERDIPIYGLEDGAAIQVNENRLIFHGPAWCIHKGNVFRLG